MATAGNGLPAKSIMVMVDLALRANYTVPIDCPTNGVMVILIKSFVSVILVITQVA